MAQKIGEALIKEGYISKEQLSKALERQVIFGGRLGTNLVELGYIKEDELTRFLSRFLMVPYAEPSYFENMDPDVLSSISQGIAEKYLVMPIKIEKNKVHLAMLDPKDFVSLDEIRFITGYEIIPYIASDLRLLHALEKYYDIKRDLRYVTIYGRAPEVVAKPGVTKPIEVEKPKEEVRVRPFAGPREKPATEPRERPKIMEKKPEEVTVRNINFAMANAKDREEIADIIMAEAARKLKRAALFMVKGEYVFGWRGEGLNLDNDIVLSIKMPLNQMSLFKDIIDGMTFHQGPLLKIPLNDKLMEDMGGFYPREVIAFPLTIRGKVVSILYGDNGDKTLLMGEYDDLKNLMVMASMAMEILILKRKIMEL